MALSVPLLLSISDSDSDLALTSATDAGDQPDSKLAIMAEGLVVERAQLTESKNPSKIHDFIPASVRSFAHSRARWDLSDR